MLYNEWQTIRGQRKYDVHDLEIQKYKEKPVPEYSSLAMAFQSMMGLGWYMIVIFLFIHVAVLTGVG